MRKYELMVIIKALLPEDVRNAVMAKFVTLVTSKGGKVLNTDVWGKKHLAYKIKKHEEGYYVVYQLELSSNLVNELKRELTLSSEILRFLLVNLDK